MKNVGLRFILNNGLSYSTVIPQEHAMKLIDDWSKGKVDKKFTSSSNVPPFTCIAFSINLEDVSVIDVTEASDMAQQAMQTQTQSPLRASPGIFPSPGTSGHN